ncbi:methyltransferase domain-containing protein [Desulfobacterales bacterium HSG2]|nr:methyltransferase domain-containing protein [Desulfobacterales bacterium HSG2]
MKKNNALVDSLRQETCPACGHHVAVPFLDPSLQPLATVAWPRSSGEAKSMQKLPLDFVSCVECGHVYNAAFDYSKVPYTRKPNLMFNKGILWSGHIDAIRKKILDRLPEKPVVVEIGHGDGSFLTGLAAERADGRYIGFDPNGAKSAEMPSVRFHSFLFEAKRHLPEFRPDLVISRHVLEHLTNPLGFIQSLSFATACIGRESELYIEVPCIDQAIKTRRTVDFYYEHNSQFTTRSFNKMLQRCGAEILMTGHIYSGEVIYAFVKLGRCPEHVQTAESARTFCDRIRESEGIIMEELDSLYKKGKKVAIWGGTGKSAAFMNRYQADARRFPVVVDSDPSKAGTYVPGMGQEIKFRDWLIEHPADVIIIPPQWRAKDIMEEMKQNGICAERVLIEHDGRLVSF